MSEGHRSRSARWNAGRVRLVVFALTALLAMSVAPNVAAQKPAATEAEVRLETGKPVERELAAGQVHAYVVELAKGQAMEFVVDQRGVDVAVDISAPDTKKLYRVDTPGGSYGPEYAFVVAEHQGPYRIEISAGSTAAPGRYEIKLVQVAEATASDRDLAEAARLESESDLKVLGIDGHLNALGRALTLREKALGPDHPVVAWNLLSVRMMRMIFRGEIDAASSARVVAALEKSLGPEHPSLVMPLLMSGAAIIFEGDVAKSLVVLERIVAIQEKHLGPEHPDLANVLTQLGTVYNAVGNVRRSDAAFRRALSLLEKSADAHGTPLPTMLTQWAGALAGRGASGEAEAILLYERALAITDRAPETDRLMSPIILQSLLYLYVRRGDTVKAEAMRVRIREIAKKNAGKEDYFSRVNLMMPAVMEWEAGNHAAARDLLERIGAGSDSSTVAMADLVGLENQAQGLLANVYRATGEYKKADAVYERLIPRLESGAMGRLQLPNFLTLRSLMCRAKGDLAAAIAHQTRANDLSERRDVRLLTSGSVVVKLAILTRMRALELDYTTSLHVDSAPANPVAARLALESILRLKGRSLDAMTDSIGVLRRRASPEDQALLDELAKAQTLLAAAVLKGGGGQNQVAFEALEDRVEELEARVSVRSAEFRAQLQIVTLDDVQRAVPRSAALVEFASYRPVDPKSSKPAANDGPPKYVAYVLAGSGAPKVAVLGDAAAIDAAVAKLCAALRDPKRTDTRRIAREVDELVMRPVRALVGSETHLLVAPDGQLNLVPFAALVDEQDRYLVERYAITYLTSGRDLLRLGVRGNRNAADVVVADPDFGGAVGNTGETREITHGEVEDASVAFGPLPGTADEARAIGAALHGAKVLTRGEATEAGIKALSGPRVLHIATHGFFLADALPSPEETRAIAAGVPGMAQQTSTISNPLVRSGLALAGANARRSGDEDGILTAMEAAGLDLWGTKLVVLSACDTGVGEVRTGQGVYGLRRALVLAGSESQVMTLWPVSDRATRDLMVGYYRRLLEGGGRTEALRHVQLEMLRNSDRSHPFFWAAFIQSGDWRPLDRKP